MAWTYTKNGKWKWPSFLSMWQYYKLKHFNDFQKRYYINNAQYYIMLNISKQCEQF